MMSDHVYKIVELTGSSSESTDDAVRRAIAKASETLRNLRWFEVIETRGYIEDGAVAYWQVTVKVGFTVDSEQAV
jgi:flavin-binding protein dodecin